MVYHTKSNHVKKLAVILAAAEDNGEEGHESDDDVAL
jgi:hypothetical protein